MVVLAAFSRTGVQILLQISRTRRTYFQVCFTWNAIDSSGMQVQYTFKNIQHFKLRNTGQGKDRK